MNHQACRRITSSIASLLAIATLSLTVPADAKPNGGIGGPLPEGSAVQKGDTWTVTGGGADIWGPADQFHFVSNSVSGSCTLIAKIISVGEPSTHDWAKAGLMIRADESVGAAHASISMSKCGAIEFITRNVPGADCRSEKLHNIAMPVFLKIERKGSDFTASYSQDGKAWMPIGGPKTVMMKSSALAGMAVTSHAQGTPCTAVFSNYLMRR
jgi:regulation of enolase protein 1 (concanavalin A-like superfamily)